MKRIPPQHLLMLDTTSWYWYLHPVDVSSGALEEKGLRCACTICKKAYAAQQGKNWKEWFE